MGRRGLPLAAALIVTTAWLRAAPATHSPDDVDNDVPSPTPASALAHAKTTGQAAGPTVDNDRSPYHLALIAYKAGNYDQAWHALEGTDPTTQSDDFVILESRVLTELKRYDDAAQVLAPRAGDGATPELVVAMGDVDLRKRAFDQAAKYYQAAFAKTHDPDLTLKLVYCALGRADNVYAGQLASQLAPFDPKNPYDDHASYYFAQAALAQATGDSTGAENNIQSARTYYGITVANRYLKNYLQFFSAEDKNAELTPAPKTNAAPRP
jgi:hypothetical protein